MRLNIFRSILTVVPSNLPLKVVWHRATMLGRRMSSLTRQYFTRFGGAVQ